MCRSALKDAMHSVGVVNFPFFSSNDRPQVTVVVDFYVSNLRKDVDNMLKFVLDVMQTIVYRDDSCVFKVVATKIPTAVGFEKTEINIEHVLLDEI